MKDATEIVCVIDKSGSMQSVKEDAIGGFNAFLQTQRELEGEATMTLALFDTSYHLVHNGTPLGDVPPLDETSYMPGGMTALYDAVVRTIDSVGTRLAEMPEDDRPDKVIVAILTDGLENSSTDHPGEAGAKAVRERIEHQSSAYAWEFLFLAANQDAVLSGGEMGIPAARAMTFDASPEGTKAAFASLAPAVSALREGRDVDLGRS